MAELIELLSFPDIDILDTEEDVEKGVIYLNAVPKHKGAMIKCPHCGCTHKHSHGKYDRFIQDVPIKGMITVLIIRTNEYECQGCHKIYTPRFICANKKDTLTKRLKEAITAAAFKPSNTFISVAEMYSVDHKTVRNLFEAKAAEYDVTARYASVRHLGIDEAHLAKDVRLVLVNTGESPTKLIDICPKGGRKAETIEALERFEDPEMIETVTMDMCRPYREAVLMALPHARIIIDRFHVTMPVLAATETARKILYERLLDRIENITDATMRKAERKKVTSFGMSAYWYKTGIENLSKETARRFAGFCKAYPEFQELLLIKESFRQFYEAPDLKTAEQAYEAWVESIPADPAYDEFRKGPIKTIANWHEYIFNYFLDPCGKRWSNGPVENRNGSIKEIMRHGKGYSFNALRAKVLYAEGRVGTKSTKSSHFSTSAAKKRKSPSTGTYLDYYTSFMAGDRSADVMDCMAELYTLNLTRIIMQRNKKITFKAAYAQAQEEWLADPTCLLDIANNNNLYIPIEQIAKSLDEGTENIIFYPVLYGVPEDTLSKEVRYYSSALKEGFFQ